MNLSQIFLLLSFSAIIRGHRNPGTKFTQDPPCSLNQSLIEEIQSYRQVADLIVETVLKTRANRTYSELAGFVDHHPNRLAGSPSLENAIDFMVSKMEADGLQKVHTEPAPVTHWIRGEETAEILEPTQKKMHILGLGPSVGTPPEGLTAEVVVIRDWSDLKDKQALIPGKIVLYNPGWQGSYAATNQYRGYGASRAAEYGAVATLIESITPYSLDTPHTGGMMYFDNVTKIPAASVTREDAELISRLDRNGEIVKVHLKMLDQHFDEPAISRNAFGEITGWQYPDEYVAVSGHIDAWDVGQGAQDDAGGCLISVEALAVIKYLELRPRRSLQAILWTSEEWFLEGAASFMGGHRQEMGKYKAAFESDTGTFKPRGLDFAGTPEAGCIVQEILKLTPWAQQYGRYPIVGTDISYMIEEGVPGLSLNTEDDKYFWGHHSWADTMMQMNAEELDANTALWAVASYVLADLSEELPRAISVKN